MRNQIGRNGRHVHYYVLAGIFFLYFLILFAPFNGMGCDDMFYYSYLSSPLFDADIDPTNDIFLSDNVYITIRNLFWEIGPKGQLKNQFAIGSPLLWLPFYLPVRAVGWVADTLFPSALGWAGDRYSNPYLFAISFGGLIYGFLAMMLVYAICRRNYGAPASLVATLGAVFASPLNAYIFSYPASSHAQSAFCIALLLFLGYRHREFRSLNDYLLQATVVGLATLVRWQNAVFALIPIAFWVEHLIEQKTLRPVPKKLAWMLAATGTLAVVVSLQCFYWYGLYGTFLTIPQGSGFMKWGSPDILPLLFSGWHGLFYNHPLMLAAYGGLALYLIQNRRSPHAYAVVLCVLIITYVNASAIAFWTGGSYACRRFAGCTPFFALGLAAVVSRFRGRWIVLPLAITAGAMLGDVMLQVAFKREMFDAFFAGQIWQLRGDVIRLLPGWLLTIPLSSYAMAQAVLLNHYGRALVTIGIGAALIGGVLYLIRAGFFAWMEKKGVWIVLAIVLIIGAINIGLLIMSLPVDQNGVLFSQIVLRAGLDKTHEEREEVVEQLLAADYEAPGFLFYVYDVSRRTELLPQYLDKAYEIHPVLRAKWVAALPPYAVDAELQRESRELLSRPPRTADGIFHAKIIEAQAAGNVGEERHWLREHLQYYPFAPSTANRLTALYRARGDYEKGFELESRLRRFLEAKIHSFLSVQNEVGKWERDLFQMNYYNFAVQLGHLYERTGKLERALDIFELMLAVVPGDPTAVEGKFRTRLQAEAPESVAEEMRRKIPDTEQRAGVWVDAAGRCADRGETTQTVNIIVTGLREHSRNPHLGALLWRAYEDVAPQDMPFEELLAHEVDSPEYRLFVGYQFNAAGRFEESEPLLKRAAEQFPQRPWPHYIYAHTLYHLHRRPEAEAELRRAVELQPDFPLAQILLVRVLYEQRKFKEALERVNAVLENNPSEEAEFLKREIESAMKE